MIELKVRHEKYPEGAAPETHISLKQAAIRIDARESDPETLVVLAVDPRALDQAIKRLNESGFEVTLGGRASYSPR
jgi:hypothetical protein